MGPPPGPPPAPASGQRPLWMVVALAVGLGLVVGGLVTVVLVWAPWRGEPAAGPPGGGTAASASASASAATTTPAPSPTSPTSPTTGSTTAPPASSATSENPEAASIAVVITFLTAIQQGWFDVAEASCTQEFLQTIGGPQALVPQDDVLRDFEVVRAEPAGDSIAVLVDETWDSGSWRSTYFVVAWEGPRLIQAAEVGLP